MHGPLSQMRRTEGGCTDITCEMLTRILKYQQYRYWSNTPEIDTSKDVTGSQVSFVKLSNAKQVKCLEQ